MTDIDTTTTNDTTAPSSPYRPDLVAAVDAELHEVDTMTTHQLAAKYRALAGHDAPIRDHRWRRRRVAMLIQQRAYRGLSEHARARLAEIQTLLGVSFETNGPTARTTISRPSRHDHVQPGMILRRVWHGTEEQVLVRDDGQLEWRGKLFPSLSAAARAISGQAWSGPLFFALKGRSRKQ